MKLWVTRWFIQEDHGSHVIGIFDSLEKAQKARKDFEANTYMYKTSWTGISSFELNKHYPEGGEEDWVEP